MLTNSKKSVEDYIAAHENFASEITLLRKLLNKSELEETIKWGAPCYVLNNKNIIGIGAFKSHFALWFFQGNLIPDNNNVLINAQEGKTKSLRQWRFHSKSDIKPKLIEQYIAAAIDIAKQDNKDK